MSAIKCICGIITVTPQRDGVGAEYIIYPIEFSIMNTTPSDQETYPYEIVYG